LVENPQLPQDARSTEYKKDMWCLAAVGSQGLNSVNTVSKGLVWFDLVWSGLIWSGLIWSGQSWFGLIWSGLIWSGLVWSGLIWSGLVWFDLVWSGLVCSGLIWSGLVWSAAVCPRRKDVKIKTFKTVRLSSDCGTLTCDKYSYVVLEDGTKLRKNTLSPPPGLQSFSEALLPTSK
jgi:hypothetical protein